MGGRKDRDNAGAWRLAARQSQLISTAQLKRLGFGEDAIRHRRDNGRLRPYRRGVWAVGHPDRSPQRDRMAAVLACGEDCALAGWSAALHRGLSERDPGRYEVVGPHRGSTRKGPRDVTLHLTDHLPVEDVETVDGVLVTSMLRTIYDCCGGPAGRPKRIQALIRQGQRLYQLDLGELRDYALKRPTTDHRRSRLLKAIDALVPFGHRTQTEREVQFLEICRKNGLPFPVPQFEVGRYRGDFCWVEFKLIAEIDDGSHGTEAARAHDAVRERHLRGAGFDTVHFTLAELFGDSALIARDSRAALTRCGWSPMDNPGSSAGKPWGALVRTAQGPARR